MDNALLISRYIVHRRVFRTDDVYHKTKTVTRTNNNIRIRADPNAYVMNIHRVVYRGGQKSAVVRFAAHDSIKTINIKDYIAISMVFL